MLFDEDPEVIVPDTFAFPETPRDDPSHTNVEFALSVEGDVVAVITYPFP
jgi:hypothetical protein